MRRFPLALSTIVAAALVAGCSSNAAAPPTGAPVSSLGSAHTVDSGIAQPHALRLFRTPAHPPPRRHAITGAMRRRARAGGWQQISSIPAFPNGPQTELLMTDGSVLVFDYCATNVYKLTPDKTGSYVTGTLVAARVAPIGIRTAVFRFGGLARRQADHQRRRVQLLQRRRDDARRDLRPSRQHVDAGHRPERLVSRRRRPERGAEQRHVHDRKLLHDGSGTAQREHDDVDASRHRQGRYEQRRGLDVDAGREHSHGRRRKRSRLRDL